MHALWTLQGLGEIDRAHDRVVRAAVAALKHPAAGVRKAAAMVLPKTPRRRARSSRPTRCRIPICTRGSPPRSSCRHAGVRRDRAGALSREPEAGELRRQVAEPRVLHRRASASAASRRLQGGQERAAVRALPVAAALGALKPDWRLPTATDVPPTGRTCRSRQLGVARAARLRRRRLVHANVDVPAGAAGAATLSLGTMRNNGEVWVNGLSVTPPGGRGPVAGAAVRRRPLELPTGTLRPGANQITVRIQNARQTAASSARRSRCSSARPAAAATALAGPWKYRIERQTNAGTLYASRRARRARGVHRRRRHARRRGAALAGRTAGARRRPALAAVPGQLKFDLAELTVAPGQLVEIVFSNPDAMQHNFVLGAVGSLDAIGAAADKLAQSPAGLAQQLRAGHAAGALLDEARAPDQANPPVPGPAPPKGGPATNDHTVPQPKGEERRGGGTGWSLGEGRGGDVRGGGSKIQRGGQQWRVTSPQSPQLNQGPAGKPQQHNHKTPNPKPQERKVRSRDEDTRRHRRARVRRRVHSHLSAPSERRDVRDLPARQEGARCGRRPLRHQARYTELRRAAEGPQRRRRPHQLADCRSRAAVDRRAEGRQARRLHGADGDDDRRVPADRRGAAEERQGLHDDGDRRLQPRVPVRQGAVRPGRARPDPVPARQPPAGHGRLARLLGGLSADALRDALRQPVPRDPRQARRARRLSRLGPHPRGADPKYGSPFAIETATFKLRDSDVCAEVTRSLFDTARQYRESFDVYGSKKSFEWQQVENEEPVIHTKSTAESR